MSRIISIIEGSCLIFNLLHRIFIIVNKKIIAHGYTRIKRIFADLSAVHVVWKASNTLIIVYLPQSIGELSFLSAEIYNPFSLEQFHSSIFVTPANEENLNE
jgi:hypothetical protein